MYFNASKHGDAKAAYKAFLSLQNHIMNYLPQIKCPDYNGLYYVVSNEEVVLSRDDNHEEISMLIDIQKAAYQEKSYSYTAHAKK